MKKYTTPTLRSVELRAEENLAYVVCYVGCCDTNGDGVEGGPGDALKTTGPNAS
jgi:hypothetical protein